MNSRTSFFNGTVLRKDITRFAPVWGLYSIFLLLVLLTLQAGSNDSAMLANDLTYLMSPMVWVNLFYAGICAAMLFGDLFNARMCNALHAMPMRREGWFLTHLTAGFLFCLIPCGAAALIACLLLQKYFYMALLWLAVTVLQFLFFFGVAVFSVMCAGNRLGMAAVYGLINFLAVLAYALIELFYAPLLHGFVLESDPFLVFSPVLHITDKEYVLFEYGKMYSRLIGFAPEPWVYLFIVAGIGAVLLVLSVLIYRRRDLESAGDFIALRPVAPVFLILYTLGMGAVLYSISMLFGVNTDLLFLGVGLLVGFFTGKMLIERTVKVFRWKNFAACFLLTAFLAGTMVLTYLDPAGITRYVPDTDKIETAFLYSGSEVHRYQYADESYSCRELTTPQEIDQCRRIHQQLTTRTDADGEYLCNVWVQYQLTDGSTVTRYYNVYQGSPAAEELQTYLSDPRSVFQVNDWEHYASTVMLASCDVNDKYAEYGTVNVTLNTREQLDGLMAAIQADCEAGNFVQDWGFHQDEECEAWLSLTNPGYYDLYLNVFTSCENTLEYLDALEAGQADANGQ